MTKWSIEAAGRFTRDIRWFEIEATDIGDARRKFSEQHGGMYRLTGISRQPQPAYLPMREYEE